VEKSPFRRNGSRSLPCPTRPKWNISGRRANRRPPGRERKNVLLLPPGRLREDTHPMPKGGAFQRNLSRRHRSSSEFQNPRPPEDLERSSASRDGFPKSLPKTRPTLTRHKRAPEARNYCPTDHDQNSRATEFLSKDEGQRRARFILVGALGKVKSEASTQNTRGRGTGPVWAETDRLRGTGDLGCIDDAFALTPIRRYTPRDVWFG
jgi:hypothetical protein